MITSLVFALLTQVPVNRLRTILPNEAAIIVDRLPGEPLISVQLLASSKYCPETPANHGFRHLLEHLVARGRNGDLDRQLESHGAFLRASTFRDFMQFQVSCPPDQIDLALSALKDILSVDTFTDADLAREKAAIDQEIGLEDDATIIASAAWTQAYGESGLDAVGTSESVHKATVDDIDVLRLKQFATKALTISIAGDVDVEAATAKARAVLEGLHSLDLGLPKPRGSGNPGRVECSGFGEARAAICKGFGSIDQAAVLCAAFGLASTTDGAFVTYTPTEDTGLVTLGRTDETSGLGLSIDAVDAAASSGLEERGKYLAQRWLDSQIKDPESDALLRGALIAQRRSAEPEDFVKALDLVDEGAFEEGVAAFYKAQAVTVVGLR